MRGPEPDWEARYLDPTYVPRSEPADFLLAVLDRLPPPPARVLDVAAGAGRNSIHLASNGYRVLAVDRSAAALEQARRRALERGVELETLAADLALWLPPAESFEVVLDFFYLERSLFPALERALVPGGIVVFETWTVLRSEGPRRRDFLLEVGELRTAFAGFEVLSYEEGETARLLARKPATPAAT